MTIQSPRMPPCPRVATADGPLPPPCHHRLQRSCTSASSRKAASSRCSGCSPARRMPRRSASRPLPWPTVHRWVCDFSIDGSATPPRAAPRPSCTLHCGCSSTPPACALASRCAALFSPPGHSLPNTHPGRFQPHSDRGGGHTRASDLVHQRRGLGPHR